MAEALRRAAADAGAPGAPRRRRQHPRELRAVVALPRSRRAGGRAAGRPPAGHRLHGHGRQLRAVRREPDRRATSRTAAPTSSCSRAASRGAPAPAPSAGAPTSTGPRSPTPCRRPARSATTSRSAIPAEFARGVVMPVHVYPMIDIALRARDGLDARRAPPPDLDAVVAVLRGGREQPERLDPAGASRPTRSPSPPPTTA